MLFISLCVTVAALCWALTTFLVAILWRSLRRPIQSLSPALSADYLFLLQIFPLLTSSVVVSLFVIPGFVVWEPDQSDESVSLWLAGVSLLALTLILAAAGRLYRELSRRPLISHERPFIAVLGCWRQEIVITQAARALLSEDELQAVIRHEAAHVERRDNFRLLVARLMSILTLSPRSWREMEAARADMTEFAADSLAVSDECSALDLAQALVKVAREFPAAEYRFASLVLPRHGSIQERVARLLNRPPSDSRAPYFALAVGAVLLLALLGAALHHELQYFCYQGLEWLVAF